MAVDIMLTILIVSAALAFTAITVQSPAAGGTPPSTNPLIRPWSGPYGGVPPWDRQSRNVSRRVRGGTRRAARRDRRDLRDASAPTFENTIAAMERAGQTLDRVSRLFGGDSPEHQHAGNPGARSRVAAEARRCGRRDRVQPGPVRARRSRVSVAAGSTLTAEQKRLTELTYDEFVRVARG